MDELIPYSPEPCETCNAGIGSMKGHDGVYRCKNCVHEYAHEQGLDQPAEKVEVTEMLVDEPPETEQERRLF